jgi:hypothetical protein
MARPIPTKLEIECVEKFKVNDSNNMKACAKLYPHLAKPAPSVTAPGKGGVNWVGLNPDPCKAKYLAKCGISAPAPEPKKKKKKKSERKPEFEEIPRIPEEDENQEQSHLIDGHSVRMARSPSLPPLSRHGSRPGTGASALSKSCFSSMYTSTSVRTSKSVQDLVQKEVRKELNRMSSHEHYLEHKLVCGNQFGTKPTTDVTDLKEALYYDVSHNGYGRGAYLDARKKMFPQDKFYHSDTCAHDIGWDCYAGPGKFVGKQLKPVPEKPTTICLG